MVAASTWGDARTLAALDMVAGGLTGADAAARLGVTRCAVLGLMKRVRDETDHAELPWRPGADVHLKPKNRDGGMPDGWWKRGLAQQAALARRVRT